MEDMMEVRRQDSELKLSDLEDFPAWEYALEEEEVEGQDERTVKPYLKSPPLDPRNAYFLVRASFRLANGVQLKGFMKPIGLEGSRLMEPLLPIDLRPVVIVEQGHVAFWYGSIKPKQEDIARCYRMLGYESQDVFPITFKSDVEVLNSFDAGTLGGFLYCEANVQDFFQLRSTDIKIVR